MKISSIFTAKISCISRWTTDKKKGAELVAKAKMWLENGMSLAVFPEGVVNMDYELKPFKDGLFRAARAAEPPISIVPGEFILNTLDVL